MNIGIDTTLVQNVKSGHKLHISKKEGTFEEFKSSL